MKRTLLLTTLSLLFISFSSQAQLPGVSAVKKTLPKVAFGVKLGANFNELHTTNTAAIQQAYKPGIVGGLFLSVRKGKFGGRLEGLLNSSNYTYTYNAAQNGTYKNLYLEIPLLFEYRIIDRLWAQAGPQFSDILSVSANPNPRPSVDPKTYFKSEFSGVIGLEAKLPVHLMLGVRYILGVTNVNNEALTQVSGSWKNRTIQAYVGFRFF